MILFHQFAVFAESRGEGLHPKLRSLLAHAVASPASEVSMRHDGLIQAGPSPDSDVISSRASVTQFSRGLTRPVAATPEPELRGLSASNLRQERTV
jgi:hypothetical protein